MTQSRPRSIENPNELFDWIDDLIGVDVSGIESDIDSLVSAVSDINDDVATNAAAIERVDPGTTGSADHVIAIVSGSPEWVPRPDGRSRVLLYDDFALHANGSPSGRTSAVGGVTWATSGSEPPTVTSGALNSTGSGYLVAELTDTPLIVEGEFSFTSMSGSATLALFRSDVANFGSMVHFEFDAEGGLVDVRADEGTFDDVISPSWPRLPLDGTMHRIRMTIAGSMLTVGGPFGVATGVYDPRIGEMFEGALDAVYWQAGDDCKLHTVAVYGVSDDGITSISDRGNPPSRTTPDSTHVVAGAFEPWQVKVGPNNDGNPAIQFGAYGGVRVPLLADIAISATSFQSPVPFQNYSGESAVIGFGDSAETVTLGSTSGGTSPYTVNISAATKAHSAGDAVLTSPPGWLLKEIILNVGTGLLTLPANTTVAGLLELGTDRDAGVQRSAAGTVQAMGAGGTAAVFRTRNGSTGDRPSASTVGAGAIYFDSTLNKLITSNGTDWRDGSGTAV